MSYKALQLALFTNDIERVKPIDKIVSPLGWQLNAAVMHKQPIQWITEQSVELILLDLDMSNSINLVSSLNRCQPNVPIIVIASSESEDLAQDALLVGAKDIISLPLHAKQLMAAMHQAIGERSTTVSNIIPNFDDVPAIPMNRAGKLGSGSAQKPAVQNVAEPVLAPVAMAQEDSEMAEIQIGNAVQPLIQGNVPNVVSQTMQQVALDQAAIESVTTLEPIHEAANGSDTSENGHIEAVTAASTALGSVDAPHREPTSHRMPNIEPRADIAESAAGNIASAPTYPATPQQQPAQPITTSQPIFTGKTTAIVSLRGGIGRSTIATNLAVAIAQKQNGSVTLIEAHHGLSNLSLMLHVHPQRTLATIENEHTIDSDIIRGYLQQHTSGVNVLCAPTEIDDMVELAPDTWGHLLNTASRLAPHMIIDTSSAADSALTEVLIKADEILIVADPDIAGLRSATGLYQNIFSEPSITGQINILINRVGVNGGLDEKTLQKQLGQDATVSLPYDPALTTYALNRGIPFVQSHPRALLSKRIAQLADFIIDDSPTATNQSTNGKPATKSSFMSFLGR